MSDLVSEILHWGRGVVTSAEVDDEDLKHAAPRADNSLFTSLADGKFKPTKRPGMTLVNQTPYHNTSASAGPPFIGGTHYLYQGNDYLVTVQEGGHVAILLDGGTSTTTATSATFASALGALTVAPDFATMNQRLFIQDGILSRMSLQGTAQVNWGVVPVAGLVAVVGAAGGMTGDYEVLVTGWDDTILAESARGADLITVTATSDKINITVNSVAVGLTNRFFRVYVRKASISTAFYRVVTGTGFVGSTKQGYPLYSGAGTVTTTIDVTDAELLASLFVAPAVGANIVPPTATRYCAVYARRMFIADDEGVYWSELDKPDSFSLSNYEPIRSRDPLGRSVTGLAVGADGRLHIFTESARVTLLGDVDVKGWQWDVDPDSGTIAHQSVLLGKSTMAWWDPIKGPVVLDHSNGQLFDIGRDLIGPSVSKDVIYVDQLFNGIRAAVFEDYFIWAVPLLGSTLNVQMLLFHIPSRRWASTRWDPMNIGALIPGFTTARAEQLYLGNYNGQLFRMWKGTNDGVRSGTASGTFVATGTSQSVFTNVLNAAGAAAAFDTTGAGLIQRKVTILDSAGERVTGDNRPYIVALNTVDDFNVSPTVTGLVNGATYTYIIGGPDFIVETFRENYRLPFTMKRIDEVFIEFRSTPETADVNLNFTTDFDDTATTDIEFEGIDSGRLSPIQTGVNFRVQVRNPYVDQNFILLKIASLARRLSSR